MAGDSPCSSVRRASDLVQTPIALGILDRNRRVGSWTRCVLQSRNDCIQPFHSHAALVELRPPASAGGQSMLARVGGLPSRPTRHLLCRSLSRFARRFDWPFGALAHRQQRNELASNGRPKPCACIPPWTCSERAVIALSNVVEGRSRLRSVDRRLKEPR